MLDVELRLDAERDETRLLELEQLPVHEDRRAVALRDIGAVRAVVLEEELARDTLDGRVAPRYEPMLDAQPADEA